MIASNFAEKKSRTGLPFAAWPPQSFHFARLLHHAICPMRPAWSEDVFRVSHFSDVSFDAMKPRAASELMRFLHARRAPIKTEQGARPKGHPITALGKGLLTAPLFRDVRTKRIEAAISVASQLERKRKMSKTQNTKTRPSHRIYSVTQQDGKKSRWVELGAAWPHSDGKGFQLKFNALPVGDCQIVLRVPTPRGASAE